MKSTARRKVERAILWAIFFAFDVVIAACGVQTWDSLRHQSAIALR
jgi:hypothetical protein